MSSQLELHSLAPGLMLPAGACGQAYGLHMPRCIECQAGCSLQLQDVTNRELGAEAKGGGAERYAATSEWRARNRMFGAMGSTVNPHFVRKLCLELDLRSLQSRPEQIHFQVPFISFIFHFTKEEF